MLHSIYVDKKDKMKMIQVDHVAQFYGAMMSTIIKDNNSIDNNMCSISECLMLRYVSNNQSHKILKGSLLLYTFCV